MHRETKPASSQRYCADPKSSTRAPKPSPSKIATTSMSSSRENNGPNTPTDEPCLLYSNKKAERLQRVRPYAVNICLLAFQYIYLLKILTSSKRHPMLDFLRVALSFGHNLKARLVFIQSEYAVT